MRLITLNWKHCSYILLLCTGQQVVGNKQPDLGSYWRILPAISEPGVDMNTQYVRNNDVIQLEHIATGSLLLTHDVASPWTRTNQEVTTTKDESKLENTFFRVVINDGDPSSFEEPWSTLTKSVFLIHAKTNVGLKVHPKELPDWGNFHYEVNGEKNAMLATNLWVATDILGVDRKTRTYSPLSLVEFTNRILLSYVCSFGRQQRQTKACSRENALPFQIYRITDQND